MRAPVSSRVDTDQRAAVITTSFAHPADDVWTLFTDPEKLARWWGPPGMPMTIEHHDVRRGGSVELTVTTPGGAIRGRWDIQEVDPPRTLRFVFTSDGLEPTEVTAEISATSDARSTLTVTVRFPTSDAMSRALQIGFVEGVARSCRAALDAVGPGGAPPGAPVSPGGSAP